MVIFCKAAMRKSCISILHLALLKPYLLDLAKDLSDRCCLVFISLLADLLLACISILTKSSCLI